MNGIAKVFAVGLAVTFASGTISPGPAGAADPAPAGDVARLQAEVTRLQTELTQLRQDLREQRQLVMNLMQADQQRYDVLLQLVRGLGATGATLPPMPPMPTPGGTGGGAAKPAGEQVAAAAAVGTVSGKVALPVGVGEAYVYVEGLKGGPGRTRQIEIKQKEKQFFPPVVAVPIGSKAIFPNVDTISHNVFSMTPGHAFDIGTIKGGGTSKPVTLSKPGHVEVFCNIHRKMRADILVVPNGYFAKVGADGSFELPGVPAGTRKVVLWAPGIKRTSQQVEVTAKGASLRFAAQADPTKPHLNKMGQVYGSYDD
jgi:plastocyanin